MARRQLQILAVVYSSSKNINYENKTRHWDVVLLELSAQLPSVSHGSQLEKRLLSYVWAMRRKLTRLDKTGKRLSKVKQP